MYGNTASDFRHLRKALLDLLARVVDLDIDALGQDVLVADLGIDSLMGIELAEEINNFFFVDLDLAEVAVADDTGSLCRLIADNTTAFSYDSDVSSDVSDTPKSSAGSPAPVTPDTEFSSDEEDTQTARRSSTSPKSVDELLNAIHKAFDIICEDFDVFAKQTGCDKFWSQVYPQQASLIVAYIGEAFAKLGFDLSSA
ncbi:hypothetical protein MMC10_010357 [Thelotrema lepadinum]|nr:hypothetical protein [Thelotrema lepadinum]